MVHEMQYIEKMQLFKIRICSDKHDNYISNIYANTIKNRTNPIFVIADL